MKIIETSIRDVLLLDPVLHGDERGFFMEVWNRKTFSNVGITDDFVQDNHSRSVRGTLRGLHYQINHPQGKLVRVIVGEVFDVAVDLRRGSSTFGMWTGANLSASNRRMMWVPPGFAHGFYVTSEYAEFVYKCTDFYMPSYERAIVGTILRCASNGRCSMNIPRCFRPRIVQLPFLRMLKFLKKQSQPMRKHK